MYVRPGHQLTRENCSLCNHASSSIERQLCKRAGQLHTDVALATHFQNVTSQGTACSTGVDLKHGRVCQEGSEQVHVIMQRQRIHHIILQPYKTLLAHHDEELEKAHTPCCFTVALACVDMKPW